MSGRYEMEISVSRMDLNANREQRVAYGSDCKTQRSVKLVAHAKKDEGILVPFLG